MNFQILCESTNDFQRVIEKLVTFRCFHFIYEQLKTFKHCAVHVILVWIQTYAVIESKSQSKKETKIPKSPTHLHKSWIFSIISSILSTSLAFSIAAIFLTTTDHHGSSQGNITKAIFPLFFWLNEKKK